MSDFPPVPNEDAPSIAIAEVVVASEAIAFDDNHQITTPIKASGRMQWHGASCMNKHAHAKIA